MNKTYFHNYKLQNENKVKKKSQQILMVKPRSVVDINLLLNRVKIEEKNKLKKKIFFFSLATIVLSFFGTFILIIK